MSISSKTTLFFVVGLLFSTSLGAQWWRGGISGEGPKVNKTLNIAKFEGFTMAVSGKVYVRQGSEQSVKVEGQQNIIDNLKTEVSGGQWKIGFEKSVSRHEGLTFWITVPTLNRAAISGSGSIIGESAFRNVGNFEAAISGSGNIQLELEASGEVSSSISGSGDIRLSGTAHNHTIHISGSGDVDGSNLRSQACEVHISGSGDCQVYADEDLTVSSSGSGDVYYRGRPRVKARVSGSGKVEPKG